MAKPLVDKYIKDVIILDNKTHFSIHDECN